MIYVTQTFCTALCHPRARDCINHLYVRVYMFTDLHVCMVFCSQLSSQRVPVSRDVKVILVFNKNYI